MGTLFELLFVTMWGRPVVLFVWNSYLLFVNYARAAVNSLGRWMRAVPFPQRHIIGIEEGDRLAVLSTHTIPTRVATFRRPMSSMRFLPRRPSVLFGKAVYLAARCESCKDALQVPQQRGQAGKDGGVGGMDTLRPRDCVYIVL